jgi:general secretion pathway protein J
MKKRERKTGSEAGTERNILRTSAGFTLLELIISFSIIALIVVIIAGAMRLAHHSVESGEKKAETLERTRASIGIINAQIQSQVPLSYMDDAKKKYYFQGDREFMQLSTNYSIWGREKGFTIVKYRIESDNNGKKMIIASENTIGIESSRETKLLTGIDKISFEYFYKGPTDEKGAWIEKWTEESSIPEKIRLNLVIAGKDFSMIIPMRTVSSRVSQPETSIDQEPEPLEGSGAPRRPRVRGGVR